MRGSTTASFTMVGPSEMRERQTIIFGTRGELCGNGEKIVHYDYLSEVTSEILIERSESGHSGGDYALMQRFIAAVADHAPN